jgi:2-succinyl-5-enolpyruvyl-6-hydroxy-3-cyclohexene-1-carboxylate synthase
MSFCTTLVDEWARAGVTDAVVAPGSRSTPLVVALAGDPRLRTHIVLDERSAAFTALGLALASGRPTVLACTSGTAGTHFHGAVVEAHQAGVPLIVCTADRPPELQDVGAPQTIVQVGLYGGAVRWSANPGVADAATADAWRSLAARAVCEATGPTPGPVHLNLMFREPLIDDDDGPDPVGRSDGQPWHRSGTEPVVARRDARLEALLEASTRPLLIVGDRAPASLEVHDVPVLGDHRGPITGTVAHWDALLRDDRFAASHEPDLVIRAGAPPASKVLARWLAVLDVPQVALLPAGRWVDPSHDADLVLSGEIAAAIHGEAGWADAWVGAGVLAGVAIDEVLDAHPTPTEPGVARAVLASRAAGSTMVVSSSMPVRDLEWFGTPRTDVRVLANRGANGIDGVTSTALGVSLTGAPTTLLIGDLAFLHDAGALLGLRTRGVDLTIVVVDNDGGGIFSFLPQRGVLDDERFEQLFGTPHGVDLAALATVHGLSATVVERPDELAPALDAAAAATGVRLVVVRTDRHANVGVHDALVAAVAAAIQPPR